MEEKPPSKGREIDIHIEWSIVAVFAFMMMLGFVLGVIFTLWYLRV